MAAPTRCSPPRPSSSGCRRRPSAWSCSTASHQVVLLDVFAALRSWVLAHPPATVLAAPVDVRFGAGRILQPDLFLVLAGLPRDAPSPITVVPDLVAEVLGGANRSYDRITKQAVYADAGLRECWVIDLQRRCVERYQGREGAEPIDTLRSALLPGFELDLPALFRDRGLSVTALRKRRAPAGGASTHG